MTCRFTIYCHTNRVNGKRYVGQTVYSMEKRWGDHVALAKSGNRRSQAITNAIRKYGADAFDHQVLEIVSTQEEADLYETLWIEQMNCRVPNGYNLKSGGGAKGHLHDDTKKLIREAARAQHQKMTKEARKIAAVPRIEGLRAWWESLSEEEYADLRRQRGERSRSWWGRLTAEERSAQQRRKQAVSPEKLSESALKSWSTRRSRYGQNGGVKSSKEYSEHAKKGWAIMSPEARAERVQKIKDGRRRAREAKTSRFMRINLFAPAIQ
jgi:group I intron endonuclease